MKPDYKNWMPKGMILGLTAGMAVCAAISGTAYGLMNEGWLKSVIVIAADAGIFAGAVMTAWSLALYKVFDYNGKGNCPGRLSRVLHSTSSCLKVERDWMWAVGAAH